MRPVGIVQMGVASKWNREESRNLVCGWGSEIVGFYRHQQPEGVVKDGDATSCGDPEGCGDPMGRGDATSYGDPVGYGALGQTGAWSATSASLRNSAPEAPSFVEIRSSSAHCRPKFRGSRASDAGHARARDRPSRGRPEQTPRRR